MSKAESRQRKEAKRSGQDIEDLPKRVLVRPFAKNPCSVYHRKGKTRRRCLTTKSFEYWVGSHVKTTVKGGNHEKLEKRMAHITNMIVLSRNLYSQYTIEEGVVRRIKDDSEHPLPDMQIDHRVVDSATEAERAKYIERAAACHDGSTMRAVKEALAKAGLRYKSSAHPTIEEELAAAALAEDDDIEVEPEENGNDNAYM